MNNTENSNSDQNTVKDENKMIDGGILIVKISEFPTISYDLVNCAHSKLESFFQSAQRDFKNLTNIVLEKHKKIRVHLMFAGEFLRDVNARKCNDKNIFETIYIQQFRSGDSITPEKNMDEWFEKNTKFLSEKIYGLEHDKGYTLITIKFLTIRYGSKAALMSKDEVD